MKLLRLLKRELQKETHEWVAAGLLSESQAQAICGRYGINYHEKSGHSYGYYVLIALGNLFIGLALITLIGHNWEEIPRAVRMGSLIALMLLFNALGIYYFRREQENAAVAWFFLGGLIYGAAIMLIAQIYHIGEHYPDGIFWWAMGVLPAALLLRSSVIMALTFALATLWFFTETHLDYFPVCYPLFLLVLGYQALRVKKNILLFLALVIGSGTLIEYAVSWLIREPHRFNFGPENVFIGAGLFVTYHGLAKWLGSRQSSELADYGIALEVWILRFAIVSLLVFSFEEPCRKLLAGDWYQSGLTVTLLHLLMIPAVAMSFVATRSLEKSASTAAFAIVVLAAFAVSLSGNKNYALYLQIGDNVVLVLTGVWLIVQGIRGGMTHYFYLGVITILLTGLLRYIDLIGDYIGAAILFAVFAAILLAAARFWKFYLTRKEVAP